VWPSAAIPRRSATQRTDDKVEIIDMSWRVLKVLVLPQPKAKLLPFWPAAPPVNSTPRARVRFRVHIRSSLSSSLPPIFSRCQVSRRPPTNDPPSACPHLDPGTATRAQSLTNVAKSSCRRRWDATNATASNLAEFFCCVWLATGEHGPAGYGSCASTSGSELVVDLNLEFDVSMGPKMGLLLPTLF
jgi:hypothetical protein